MALKYIALIMLALACGPQDPKLEDPLLTRKSQNALQDEFVSLFGSQDEELSMSLPLMLADFNLEAAKILEFSTNIESEIARYQNEVEREARGERANSSVLCREIQKVTDTSSKKVYVVTYNCNGRSDLIRNEVRGQELYELLYEDNILKSISLETYAGFETRALRYFAKGERNTMSGVSANIREDRKFKAMSVDGLNYSYNYGIFFDYDQTFRVHPRNYKDGYTDAGTINATAKGDIRLELSGEKPRYYVRELKASDSSRGSHGALTIKGDRSSIDRSKLPFTRFYILTANLKSKDSMNMNYNNCAEFSGSFESEARWLSGKPQGNNQFRGTLTMLESQIDYTPRGAGRNNEVNESPRSRTECYGRSPILPLVMRNKFFLF